MPIIVHTFHEPPIFRSIQLNHVNWERQLSDHITDKHIWSLGKSGDLSGPEWKRKSVLSVVRESSMDSNNVVGELHIYRRIHSSCGKHKETEQKIVEISLGSVQIDESHRIAPVYEEYGGHVLIKHLVQYVPSTA